MVNFNKNSIKTLEKRYLLKDNVGKIIETPEQMLERTAITVCKDNTTLKTKILEMMHDLRFLPNTPTLMNAGTTNMLSACFVIDIDDTLESIVHDAGWQQAYIHKQGGGVGINFSKLRPKGDAISTTGGVTTGVMGFLPIFNELSESIRQGGKRDGANMGILSISHPEIESWITAKVGNNKFRNFNLSVLVTDKFMEAVDSDSDWDLTFNNKVYKTIKSQYLFELICNSTHSCGCPGIIFEDEINRDNPLSHIMWINTTNPCVTGDTEVLTPDGEVRVDSLKVGDLITVPHNNDYPIKRIEINGDMPILKIQFNNNPSIKVSYSHKFLVEKPTCTYANGDRIPLGFIDADYLKVGDVIRRHDHTYTTITHIEKCQNETVYDIFEPKTDMWITNGLISRGCGEQPLYIGHYNNELISESCNLGSLNVSKYCTTNEKNDGFYIFNKEKYIEDIYNATEFLDLVIDANKYPFDFIQKGTTLTRKIGLGITGLSECLIKLGLVYGSNESLKFIEKIMEILKNESHNASAEIGRQKGFFPLSKEANLKRRNLFTTTIAPTGTIGRLMLGHPYSSGIEPPFAIYTSSNIIDTKIDDGIHPLLLTMLHQSRNDNHNYSHNSDPKYRNLDIDSIIKKIKENGKSIQHIKEIPKHIRKLFRVAEEISIEEHISVQSIVQEYIDNAVSKTINMSNDATIEDVKKAYILAWKTKCKGVTVYRDNSKDTQVFETTSTKKGITIELNDLPPRPEMLGALSFTRKTTCNTLFINPTFLGKLDKTALEAFISANGGCVAMRTGLAMAISVYQRILESLNPEIARKSLNIVTSHLLSIPCQVCLKQIEKEKYEIEKGKKIKHPVDSISCPSAVASAVKFLLEHKVKVYIDDEPLHETHESIKTTNNNNINSINNINKKKCPSCGGELFKQEGCGSFTCVCGYGGCS